MGQMNSDDENVGENESGSVGTTIIYQRKSEENLSFKCAKKENDSGNN